MVGRTERLPACQCDASSPVFPCLESGLTFRLLHNRLGQFVSKFEIEKYTVCGKHILPKQIERHFFIFFWAQLACEYAWICEYLQASCIQHF